MEKAKSKMTSWGQVSVPAAVRRFLHLAPGSVLEWKRVGDRIVVERARRRTTAEVCAALFAGTPPAGVPGKTLAELKRGVREHMRRRHSGR